MSPLSPWGESRQNCAPLTAGRPGPALPQRPAWFGLVTDDRFQFQNLLEAVSKNVLREHSGTVRQDKPHGHLTDRPFQNRGTVTRLQKRLEVLEAKSPTEWGSTISQEDHFDYWIWRSDTFEMRHFTNSAEIRNTSVLIFFFLNELRF